jgi:hypothetical protein
MKAKSKIDGTPYEAWQLPWQAENDPRTELPPYVVCKIDQGPYPSCSYFYSTQIGGGAEVPLPGGYWVLTASDHRFALSDQLFGQLYEVVPAGQANDNTDHIEIKCEP